MDKYEMEARLEIWFQWATCLLFSSMIVFLITGTVYMIYMMTGGN